MAITIASLGMLLLVILQRWAPVHDPSLLDYERIEYAFVALSIPAADLFKSWSWSII